jgi:hypothetical protein
MQKYVTIEGGSRHARLRLFGYYVQRTVTSRRLRRVAARLAVAVLASMHGRRRPGASGVESLKERGYAQLGQLLSASQCAEALDWLRKREMIAVRSGGRKFLLDDVPKETSTADFPLETIVHCPHIMALANHPDLLRMAGDYLGYTPTITLMGLRWSFPSDKRDADVQAFHRDVEPGSIKMLVYLTDVDEDSGPHSYVSGTHSERMPMRMRRYSDQEIAREYGNSVVITGPAGTAFFIDNRGIHKGTPPARGKRLLLVVQYSLLPCLMYDYAPIPWQGEERFDPYTNRLMIAMPELAASPA